MATTHLATSLCAVRIEEKSEVGATLSHHGLRGNSQQHTNNINTELIEIKL